MWVLFMKVMAVVVLALVVMAVVIAVSLGFAMMRASRGEVNMKRWSERQHKHNCHQQQ